MSVTEHNKKEAARLPFLLCVVFRAAALIDVLHLPVDFADGVGAQPQAGGVRVMLVKYMAVRDRNGQYIGTLELVQDMEFAREYFERKHD